ncbi:MAG: LysM peptidoglycan-binding domain-containing protein, partial [Bacillota bacterium]|nr:LysM peptidoglycan-binding domain-containing protein [Bacillota bacterium]
MQIHVVQRNDSITTIARQYHSTVNDIVEANDLPNPNNLVIGQAIVIPIIGQFYTVKQGDNI